MSTELFENLAEFLSASGGDVAVIIPVHPDHPITAELQSELTPDIASHLMELKSRGVLEPDAGNLLTSFATTEGRTVRLVCVGTGPSQVGFDEFRSAVGEAIRSIPRAESVVLFSPNPKALRAVVEGAHLGDYRFDGLKEKPAAARAPFAALGANAEMINTADVVATAVNRARDLGNSPPSMLTPQAFADQVEAESQELSLRVTRWDAEQLAQEGFGGITGVGIGSANPPVLVKVEYAPEGATAHVSFVGKGITFDSGGLGIKPRPAMLWMKCDMGGAAAVYGAITAIARLGLPIKVTSWLALAENMPSGTATKPLDVLTMKNGVTVEVADTDAEGRLVLGDALVVAAEENPHLLVDVATLTGAQIVALGNRTSAVMAPTPEPAEQVLTAARDAGELMWELPMPAHLARLLDTPVADLANMGGNEGGVIVAAHFLQRFVPAEQPWVHVDIAGPAINTEGAFGYTTPGGTGAGVRTLVSLAQNLSSDV